MPHHQPGGAPTGTASRTTTPAQRLLAAVLIAGIALTAVVVLASSDGHRIRREPGEIAAGQRRTARALAGIPQAGYRLGRPGAPVRIVEFADLQCPFCASFAVQELPAVIRDQVRTGRATLELRLLDILDRGGATDSARLAAVADAAGRRGRLWNLAEIAFLNQGAEGSGYATDAFLRRMARAAGVSPRAALAAPGSPEARAALARDRALARHDDVRGTPTVLVGRRGAPLRRIDRADAGSIASAVRALEPAR